MVNLVQMSQSELDEYLRQAIQTLADELMKANGWSAEQSLKASVQSFDVALPNRLVDSSNQCLRTILVGDERVGVLWYGIRGPEDAFVWDLLIYPAWRNKGYGTKAMRAMEEELRQIGITKISLNVFAHNTVAARMYSNMGYEPISTKMIKKISKTSSGSLP